MKQAAGYAIVYDLTDDRERARVDRIIKGYGFRVQKSVFECRLTRGDRRSLIAALERLRLLTGSVKIYRIYGGTESVVVGAPMEDRDDDAAFVV